MVSSEDPMRSYLLLELITQFMKYACFYDTGMPLRLKLGSEILIVHLLINSIMNLYKYSIVKVFPSVIKHLGHLIAKVGVEINSILPWISEIPFPQQFFFRAC
jgi:hypothetical protein